MRLEETDGLAHRALDVERLHVLPVFLEQRDKEVDAWKKCEQLSGNDEWTGSTHST